MLYPVVIQARLSSTRLPGKVLTPFLNGMSMLEYQYTRLSKFFPTVVIATSDQISDDPIYELCLSKSFTCYRGDLNNVMARLLDAALSADRSGDTSFFIRVGGDDPLISPEGISLTVNAHVDSRKSGEEVSMAYSSHDQGLPYGCACESFHIESYQRVFESVMSSSDPQTKKLYLEHTKPAFLDPSINLVNSLLTHKVHIPSSMTHQSTSLSVDYPEDFLLTSYIAQQIVARHGFLYSHKQLLAFLTTGLSDGLKINSSLHDGFGE